MRFLLAGLTGIFLVTLTWVVLDRKFLTRAGALSEQIAPAIAAVPVRSRLAVPGAGAYTGAYVDFGDTEDSVTLEAILKFEQLTGKHQAVVASSSYWGKNVFPSRNLEIISAYGAVPLVFWLPWDRDLYESRKLNRFDLRALLTGQFDRYIEQWGAQAAAYGKPLLVAFGIEMNGNWFPWSGVFYGANRPVPETSPVRYEGPELYKQAYRYVVDRVRAQGARNISWVFHANNTSDPEESWNVMKNYYPGSAYVDWLALSAYGQQFPESGWVSFERVLPKPYKELCELDPDKPVLLAEWGVANFWRNGSMSAWISEAFRRYRVEFPRLKGAVYWHERWQNGDGSISNLRVNATDEGLRAYREGVADRHWLAYPQYEPVR